MVNALANRQVLYRSDALTLVYVERDLGTVFATFNDMRMLAERGDYAQSHAMAALGATVLGFVSARPNWYPPKDMHAAIEAATSVIAGRRLVTFGFGQGGYGAFKYASRLSATLALAFSPQWSINPADVGRFDRRFAAFYDPALQNGERVERDDLGARNIIFVDRLEQQDRKHAERLIALGGVDVVPMPFAGIYSFRQFSQTGREQELFRLCYGDVDAADLRRLVRASRVDSLSYLKRSVAKLGYASARHTRFFGAAVERLPDGPDKALARIWFHVACDDLVAAEQELAGLSDNDLLSADLVAAWRSFERSSFMAGERRIVPLLKRRYPTDMTIRRSGVEAMIRLRLDTEAVAELKDLQTAGEAAPLQDGMDFYLRLQRPDLLSRQADDMLNSGALSVAQRMDLGFEIAEACRQRKMRTYAALELLKISKLSVEDTQIAIRLVELGMKVEAYSFVADVIAAHPDLATSWPVIEVYAVRCIQATTRGHIKEALKQLHRQDVHDGHYWEQLAMLSESPLGPKPTLSAMRKAILHSGETVSATRRVRLAWALLDCKRRREALQELKKVIGDRSAQAHLGGTVVHLALELRDQTLARSFAMDWLAAHPEGEASAPELIEASTLAIKVGEKAAAQRYMVCLLKRLETGLALRLDECTTLIEVAQQLDFAIERRAVAACAAQHPREACFRALSSSGRASFAAGFAHADRDGSRHGPRPQEGQHRTGSRTLDRLLGLIHPAFKSVTVRPGKDALS